MMGWGAVVLSVAALVLGVAGVAWGHGAAPAVIEVLSLSGEAAQGFAGGDPARPDVVRTSVGMARSTPSGAYEFMCYSQWDGYETALAAALADRAQIITMARGVIYLSTDGGCLFEPLPVEERWYGLAVHAWGGRLWVLARELELGARGDAVVLELAPDGTLVEVWRWEGVADGGTGFIPDDLQGWGDEAAGGLVVSGARPRPEVWVAAAAGGGALAWRALEGLPEIAASRLDVQAVTARGDVWLLAAQEAWRGLWRGAPEGGASLADATLRWEGGAPQNDVVHGPLLVDGWWVAVIDGVLQTQPAAEVSEGWTPHGEVDWTCLQALGEVRYACTLDVLYELTAIDGGGAAQTRPVFAFAQLGPPAAGCPAESGAALACQSDWVSEAGGNGWLGREPATGPVASPDVADGDADAVDVEVSDGDAGAGEDDLEVSDVEGAGGGGDEGCGCRVAGHARQGGGWPWVGLGLLIGLGVFGRRDPATARVPGTTPPRA